MSTKFKGYANVTVSKNIKIPNDTIEVSQSATANATSDISKADAVLLAENDAFNYALKLIDNELGDICNAENTVICKIVNTSSEDLVEIIDDTDDRYYTYNKGFNLRFTAYPKVIIFPYTSEGALYAVQYALKHNLRPTVGSGHHCYENFVMQNDGGVLIDMFFMQKLTKENDIYIMETGVTNWAMQQQLLANFNVTIPGGSCYSVAAGGHICGGGYGFLSRLHGLTVDYLYGVEMVVVDENKNAQLVQCFKDSKTEKEQNLWWGNTGGGGGNFGIITRYFLKDLPQPPASVYLTTGVSFSWYDSNGNLIPFETFSQVLINYGNYMQMLNEQNKDNDLFALVLVGYIGKSSNAFQATIQSVNKEATINFINAVFGNVPYTMTELSWLSATMNLNGSGSQQRFKNKSAYMNKPFTEKQLQVIYKWYSGGVVSSNTSNTCQLQIDTYGGNINTVSSTATAVAARSAIMKLQFEQYWTFDKDDKVNIGWVNGVYNDLYGVNGPWDVKTGLAGCYVNYPDCELKNWEFLYWQQNYKRLQLVKQQWDPNNIFNHAQSVRLPYDGSITLFISGYANYISKYILTKQRTLVYQGQFNCLDNPSWMAYDSNIKCLFATSEVNDYNNLNSGAVQSFKVDNALNLQPINNVSSIGVSPCNIFIDNTNKSIFTSNYVNGIMSVIPYTQSGKLKKAAQTIVHTPTDVSHIHDTIVYKNIVNIVDLGLDTVTQYLITDAGDITQKPFNTIQFPTGSGPRQIKIHSSGTFAVVVCEEANTLTILPMELDTGIIINKQFSNYFTISTLPTYQVNATNMFAAQIQFSESGQYVYVSNRDQSSPNKGRSSISSFKINFGKTIKLTWLQTVSSGGEYPRYFTFLNEGNIIAIVNQVDGNFVSYLMDTNTGFIKPKTVVSSEKNILTRPSFILPF
jgi:6-phosphogluconolactonase (cycloisomerase 2 family)